MPVCKKCQTHFSNRVIIDGKKRNLCNRKYCLVCSPFGTHNTKKIDIVEEKNEKGEVVGVCKYCGRRFNVGRRKNGCVRTTKACGSCVVNRRRFVLKKRMVEYKGGKCVVCGYSRCLDAMCFHHRNPNEKDFNVSGAHCRKWSVVRDEIDKCDLMCCRCHVETHADIK